MIRIWFVYIIQATDGSLYTGVTLDINRRWQEHSKVLNKATKGAKFFRGRKPESLVFAMTCENRSRVCKEESSIKKLTRKKKLLLIASNKNQLAEFPELSHLKSDLL